MCISKVDLKYKYRMYSTIQTTLQTMSLVSSYLCVIAEYTYIVRQQSKILKFWSCIMCFFLVLKTWNTRIEVRYACSLWWSYMSISVDHTEPEMSSVFCSESMKLLIVIMSVCIIPLDIFLANFHSLLCIQLWSITQNNNVQKYLALCYY